MLKKMITANATTDGRTVYLAPRGVWSRSLSEGVTFGEGEALEEALAAATRDEASVCGPYAIEVTSEDGALSPVSLREQIRSQGPTVGDHATHSQKIS
jgi:hypothetical protein